MEDKVKEISQSIRQREKKEFKVSIQKINYLTNRSSIDKTETVDQTNNIKNLAQGSKETQFSDFKSSRSTDSHTYLTHFYILRTGYILKQREGEGKGRWSGGEREQVRWKQRDVL